MDQIGYLPLVLFPPLLVVPPSFSAVAAPALAPPTVEAPPVAANAVALVILFVTLPAVACAVTEYVAMKGPLPTSASALPANGTEPEVSDLPPPPTSVVATKVPGLPPGLGDIANSPKSLPIVVVGLTPLNT